MKKIRSIVLTICLVAVPGTGFADLGPIVITPTRTAQQQNTSSATVYLLSHEDINASGATNTAELLRSIPGVQVDDLFGNGTQVNISVRGFSSTANANTLVLINGRRLNYSDTASPDLHHIFPRDIERIEVMSGSAGSLYGDQAVGGVINIVTRRPDTDSRVLSMGIGSFNDASIGYYASRQLTDTLAYNISAQRFVSDHYRDHNAELNSNVRGLLEYHDSVQNAFVELQKIADDVELPGALLKSEFDADPQQINSGFSKDFTNEDSTFSRLGYETRFAGQLFSIDATRRTTDADVKQSFRNHPSPLTGFIKRGYNSLNPKLSGEFLAGVETPYVVGIDLEKTDYDLNIPFDFFGPGVTTASNQQNNRSIFFQVMPRVSENLQLTLGMRRSNVDNQMKDGNSFAGGLATDDSISVHEFGLTYTLADGSRITVRADQNFRFAKVNELAQAEPGKILKTQTGDSYEFGIETTLGDQQLVASIYRLDLKNEIEFDPTAGLFGVNVNLDRTRRDGLSLSLISQIDQTLSLNTQIGLVDAKFKSGTFSGNEISGISRKIMRIRLDYQIYDSLGGYFETQYSGSHYAQGDNGNAFEKRSPVTVLNLGVRHIYKAWETRFIVKNLADKKYAEFVSNNGFGAAYQPSPGRSYMINTAYHFK